MLIQEAGQIIAAKLLELNQTHLATGGAHDLQSEDWTWERRAREMRARVDLLAADGFSMPVLTALGAHVVAAMLAVDEAELMDVASGEDTLA